MRIQNNVENSLGKSHTAKTEQRILRGFAKNGASRQSSRRCEEALVGSTQRSLHNVDRSDLCVLLTRKAAWFRIKEAITTSSALRLLTETGLQVMRISKERQIKSKEQIVFIYFNTQRKKLARMYQQKTPRTAKTPPTKRTLQTAMAPTTPSNSRAVFDFSVPYLLFAQATKQNKLFFHSLAPSFICSLFYFDDNHDTERKHLSSRVSITAGRARNRSMSSRSGCVSDQRTHATSHLSVSSGIRCEKRRLASVALRHHRMQTQHKLYHLQRRLARSRTRLVVHHGGGKELASRRSVVRAGQIGATGVAPRPCVQYQKRAASPLCHFMNESELRKAQERTRHVNGKRFPCSSLSASGENCFDKMLFFPDKRVFFFVFFFFVGTRSCASGPIRSVG